MNGLEYTVLTGEESFGSHGFGVRIMIATTAPMPKAEALKEAGWKAREMVRQALEAAVIANDAAAQQRAVRDRRELLALFPGRIFVEAIPNGYCGRACCSHLPWFVVTTEIGRFKIGWRKRVIHIEWTETIVRQSAEELFPQEQVTKHERLMHAWSLEDAQRYIDIVKAAGIVASARGVLA